MYWTSAGSIPPFAARRPWSVQPVHAVDHIDRHAPPLEVGWRLYRAVRQNDLRGLAGADPLLVERPDNRPSEVVCAEVICPIDRNAKPDSDQGQAQKIGNS